MENPKILESSSVSGIAEQNARIGRLRGIEQRRMRWHMKLVKQVVLALVAVFALSSSGRCMFILQQTQSVPIGRVLANLRQQLTNDPNNIDVLYHLGRVYSMAYATNMAQIPVVTNRGGYLRVFGYPAQSEIPHTVQPRSDATDARAARENLTNAIVIYRRAAALVMKGTNATANKWILVPIHLGLAWSIDQSGDKAEAIKAYREALQLAWQQEVDPGFTLSERAGWAWNELRAGRNPLKKPPARMRGSVGPGACYSCEIIGYLLNLLDPTRDATEIAQLRADQKLLQSMPRAITPILVPLGATTNLAELVNENASVQFDLDGTGEQRSWGWITRKAAWLVYDGGSSGKITSGLQMFGNVTFWIFWRNGYDALSSLDDNRDGVLAGTELQGLALWADANGNGVSEPGEVTPLSRARIREIRFRIRNGDGLSHPQGVMLDDGTTRPTFDWIAPGK